MKHRKIMVKFTFSLFLLCLLTGCWDKRELEEHAYVIGLGMDRNEVTGNLNITFLIANPEVGSQQSGGSSGGGEPAQEVLTIAANDFITARNTANAVISRALTYDLLKVFVVSEKLASDKDFIRYIYDAVKDREIRKDAFLIITKEDAEEFLNNNKPKLETRPHKYFQYMINRGIDTGLIPDSDLNRFFKVTESDAELFLAIYATTQLSKNPIEGHEDEYVAGEIETKGSVNKTQFIGSAVFKEGVMIGKINGQETRISMILDDTSDISDVLTTYPDPFSDKFRIATRVIKKQNNKVKMDLKNGPPKINVQIPLMIEVLSDPSMTNYSENEKNKKILKNHLEDLLSEKFETFAKKMQEKYKGEAFMWSAEARKKFKTIPEYEKYDWMKTYPEAEIKIKIVLTFGEFGKQAKVPNFKMLRD